MEKENGIYGYHLTCKTCGAPLKWGRFAYNQDTCWNCFADKVKSIANKCETSEEKEIVLHIFKIVEYYQKI